MRFIIKCANLTALGDAFRQPLPYSAVTNETFKRPCAEGHSEKDFAAVYLTIR